MSNRAATRSVQEKLVEVFGAASLLMLVAAGWAGPAKATELVVGGTGAAIATMQALGAEYGRLSPGVNVKVLPSLGSGGGVKALLAGKISIAVTSRPLSEAERSKGVRETEIARTPFVIATGLRNPVSNLTFGELASLYSGKTARWADGTPVRPILRPADDIDSVMLQALSPEVAAAATGALKREGMNIATTDTLSADELEKIPGAFGTSSLSILVSEKRALKAVALNGMEPSLQALADRKYAYYKTIYLVTGESVPPAVDGFIKFVKSVSGANVLARTGNLASARQ